jgi:MarR family 2-MHQ and catechol resistance regulon transcriptional repressor
VKYLDHAGGAATTEFIVLDDGLLTERAAHTAAAGVAQRDGLDPLTHEAHMILFRAYTSLTATVRRNNPSRLSLGRYNVLRLLHGAEDNRLLMSEIGDGLEISPTVVTRLVDSLAAEGLVERADHPDDKRKTWAVLTPAGRTLFEAEMPAMLQQIEKLWKGLMPEEKRLLIHLLTKLRLSLVTASPDEVAELAQGAR